MKVSAKEEKKSIECMKSEKKANYSCMYLSYFRNL